MSEEEIKCEICGSNYSENYYHSDNDNRIICEECLLNLDGITTSTETYYYIDGEYAGSDNNLDDLIENICDYLDYKVVE